MKFLQFINSHKTKITGFLLVIAGSLQANTTILQGVLTEKQYAWLTVGVGCVVAALGFLNSRAEKPE